MACRSSRKGEEGGRGLGGRNDGGWGYCPKWNKNTKGQVFPKQKPKGGPTVQKAKAMKTKLRITMRGGGGRGGGGEGGGGKRMGRGGGCYRTEEEKKSSGELSNGEN